MKGTRKSCWKLNAAQSAAHQLPLLPITLPLGNRKETYLLDPHCRSPDGRDASWDGLKSPSQAFLLPTGWDGFSLLVRSVPLAPVSMHPSAPFTHPTIF